MIQQLHRTGLKGHARIHSGDFYLLSKLLLFSNTWELLNSLCFALFPARFRAHMNADVVCHTLEFCKQDPGQPLCHLYPLPKVSGFSFWMSDHNDMQALWTCCKGRFSFTGSVVWDRDLKNDIFHYITQNNIPKVQLRCLPHAAKECICCLFGTII